MKLAIVISRRPIADRIACALIETPVACQTIFVSRQPLVHVSLDLILRADVRPDAKVGDLTFVDTRNVPFSDPESFERLRGTVGA